MRKDYTHNGSKMDWKIVNLMFIPDVHQDHKLDYSILRTVLYCPHDYNTKKLSSLSCLILKRTKYNSTLKYCRSYYSIKL